MEDTQAPFITILGANPSIVQLGQPYQDPGAVAMDLVDGEVTVTNASEFISYGLVFHLDAETLADTLQDSETVTTWPDISGKNNHADNVDAVSYTHLRAHET